MRALLIIAAIAMTAPAAHAQKTPERPGQRAPQAAASFETREDWCQQFASWFIAQTPTGAAMPSDVSPTHRFEVEFNSCKPDPQQYERDALAELTQVAELQADRVG